MKSKGFEIGEYRQEFNDLTKQEIPCGKIYQAYGFKEHIKNRHPSDVGLVNKIPDVIKSPDYVGKDPNRGESLELIKQGHKNIKLCLEWDMKENYMYASTIFSITNQDLKKFVSKGRWKKYKPSSKKARRKPKT